MLIEIKKHPRPTPQTIQDSVNMLNIKAHSNTIRVARRKLLLSKKDMAARLRFTRLHLRTTHKTSGTISFG